MTVRLRNTTEGYGLPAVLLHWVMAVLVIGLFGLGLYMTGLDYYDPWYHQAPWWHKSIGLVVLVLLVLRALWALANPKPTPLPTHSGWEIGLAHVVHTLLYGLLFCICISGYLISTADGRGVEFFGWMEIPALIHGIEGQEDIAGDVHFLLAISTIALAALHALAALKHHFLDRDQTLRRMLG